MEKLRRILSRRAPSFVVVDMPTDSSSLFNVNKEKLIQLAKNKNQDILSQLGGVDGIILSLKTHASYGIRGDAADLCQRINFSGSSSCRIRGVVRRYLLAVLDRLKDWLFLFLCICCVYLIIVGIQLDEGSEGWLEGTSVLFFSSTFEVISAIIGQGFGDYFDKAIRGSQLVIVLRNGLKQQIPVTSLLVGDIALLKTGDEIPADGLLLEANGDQSLKLDYNGEIAEINHDDPFLSTGARVVEGQAKMMVTSTVEGKNFGYSYEMTELGAQIDYLIRVLEIMRLALALSSFLISLSLYFSGTLKDDDGDKLFNPGTTSALEVSFVIVDYIVGATVLCFVMDTSNFSWALKVCFAHAINMMASYNVIVRNLSSWEKIGLSVATINVIDEFNASNQLKTSNFLFVPQITKNKKASSCIASKVRELIQQGIGLNTTGISNHEQRKCKLKFSGSPRERAFLSQAGLKSGMDWNKLMNECEIIRVETLENQGRVILVKKDDSFLEHRRGPVEVILATCSGYYDDVGILRPLDEDTRSSLEQKLQSMSSDSRTQVIALAYRKVPDQESKEDSRLEEEEACCSLLGFVVLKEVNQDEIVHDVVQKYRNAWMDLNIVHEENLDSAVAGAADTEPGEMGINQGLENETLALGTTVEEDIMECEGGNASEETTENCTELANPQENFGSVKQCEVFQEVQQKRQKVDLDNGADGTELGETGINDDSDDGILTRGTTAGEEDIIESEEECNESKEDGECPKEVVSVTGSEQIHNATDIAEVEDVVTALSEAIVTISVGIDGGNMTRTSKITILDGKYTSLPLILMWAKCMLLNTQAFTQFQLSMMITNILTEIISVAGQQKTSRVGNTLAYQLVQEIWVNNVMGLIAVVTFGRQRPQPSITLLQKPPEEDKIWLITWHMWRNIMTQTAYQITIISVLYFRGVIFGFNDKAADTATFVVPILYQVLNMISARKIEEKNIFSGIRPGFIWLIAMLVIAPFVLVETLSRIVHLERLDEKQWATCIAISLVSWPVGFAAKFMLVRFFAAPVRLVAAPIMSVVYRLEEVGNWIKSTASKLAFC